MVPSIYIPGTKPNCLVSTQHRRECQLFRDWESSLGQKQKKNDHPKLRSLSGHASIILINHLC